MFFGVAPKEERTDFLHARRGRATPPANLVLDELPGGIKHVTETAPHDVIVFGEVLVDVFPGSEPCLGGAPFNVAWNLRGFGMRPLFLSRVGRDERGDRIVAKMQDWGLDTSGVQRDARRPTGSVEVTLVGGEPHYEIADDVAWDHIEPNSDTSSERTRGAWLYHGSLALRSETNRDTLAQLLASSPRERIVDVNLRDPFRDRDLLEEQFAGATILKMNRDELDFFSSEYGGDGSLASRARSARERLKCDGLVVTCGDRGSFLIDERDRELRVGAPEGVNVVDTVGAGDAFTSVFIVGRRRKWPLDLTLARAAEFAGMVCGVRGAVIEERGFFVRLLERWRSHDAAV